MNLFGVIDLGTNTFHLLIVRMTPEGSLLELHRERRFIKLAENGIEKIGEAPFQRGIQAIMDYKKILDHYGVKDFVALGTAALRTASNGSEFITQIKHLSGISIQLISGQEEARLIHKGVCQAVPFDQRKNLIMDIGGGSVEFIICNQDQVFWSDSFPVGVAVLFKNFHHTDPISIQEIEKLCLHLEKILSPLVLELQNHKIQSLVGASGTFDVLENILVDHKKHPLHSSLPSSEFQVLHQKILKTRLPDRLAMEGVPENRADMIVVAMILIDFILQKADIQQITVSAYAMKEGLIYDLIPQ